jgi:glycosyltransferase involved in cell wall biosynthesis
MQHAKAPIRVGTSFINYLTRRNISDLGHTRYSFEHVWDWYQLKNKFYTRVLRRPNSYQRYFTYQDDGIRQLMHPGVQLLHFINAVSKSTTPWFSTFETLIPRYEYPVREDEIELLARPACKGLFAVSECTYRYQKRFLEERFPSYVSAILPKVHVVKVPQKPLMASPAERKRDPDFLQLTYVGTDMLLKGGYEVTRLAERLLARKLPVKITIVGRPTHITFPFTSTEFMREEVLRIVAKYPQIDYREWMPNPEVLALYKATDISLLPTWADTAPYGVLESMASGSPVIGSDVRNMTETIQPERGWLLNLPQTVNNDINLQSAAQQVELSDYMVAEMERIVEDALNRRAEVNEMGVRAWSFVSQEHNAANHLRRMEGFYDAALGLT